MPTELLKAMNLQYQEAYRQCLGTSVMQCETNQAISPSFLIKILAHPVTKAIGAILLLAGLITLAVGACGLAGAAIGISALLSHVMLSVGAGTFLLGTFGLFAHSKAQKYPSDEVLSSQQPQPNPIESSA